MEALELSALPWPAQQCIVRALGPRGLAGLRLTCRSWQNIADATDKLVLNVERRPVGPLISLLGRCRCCASVQLTFGPNTTHDELGPVISTLHGLLPALAVGCERAL